jgi:hypothetical protein
MSTSMAMVDEQAPRVLWFDSADLAAVPSVVEQ